MSFFSNKIREKKTNKKRNKNNDEHAGRFCLTISFSVVLLHLDSTPFEYHQGYQKSRTRHELVDAFFLLCLFFSYCTRTSTNMFTSFLFHFIFTSSWLCFFPFLFFIRCFHERLIDYVFYNCTSVLHLYPLDHLTLNFSETAFNK